MSKLINNEDRVLKLIAQREKEIPQKLVPILEKLIKLELVEENNDKTYSLTDLGRFACRKGVNSFLKNQGEQNRGLPLKQKFLFQKSLVVLLSAILFFLLLLTIHYFLNFS